MVRNVAGLQQRQILAGANQVAGALQVTSIYWIKMWLYFSSDMVKSDIATSIRMGLPCACMVVARLSPDGIDISKSHLHATRLRDMCANRSCHLGDSACSCAHCTVVVAAPQN
jgi:hypothetical protein